MRSAVGKGRHLGAATATIAALLAAGSALGANSITKHNIGAFRVLAGQTRTFSLPFPDALEYGNASYSGRAIVIAPKAGAPGPAPSLKRVKILYAGPALGDSSYEVRAHNGNRAGTAAIRIEVIATTVEALPHS